MIQAHSYEHTVYVKEQYRAVPKMTVRHEGGMPPPWTVDGSEWVDTYAQAHDNGIKMMVRFGGGDGFRIDGFRVEKTYVRATKEEAEQGIAEDLADVYDREADEYRQPSTVTTVESLSDTLARVYDNARQRPPVRLMKVAEQPGLIGAQQIQTWRAGDHIVAVTINDGEIAKIELVK